MNYNNNIFILRNIHKSNDEEAKYILSIENIKNYSLYIDEKYLNKERIKKICANCNKYHYSCKKP